MKRMIYEGVRQNEISFPLGGLGCGSIGLSGSGRLIDWEIFNIPNKGSDNGHTHFAIRAERADGTRDARVIVADIGKDRDVIGVGAGLTDGNSDNGKE